MMATARIVRTAASWKAITAGALLVAFAPSATAQLPGPLACEGPPPEAVEPGTPEWLVRDANNLFCAAQRHADMLLHPVLLLPIGEPVDAQGRPVDDAYRLPARHAGTRFRFDTAQVTTPEGESLAVEIYRPCAAESCSDRPEALRSFQPPYPAVVSIHGGASRKELHWWSSQPLAEAGYMVISFDDDTLGTSPTAVQVLAMLDWLFAGADSRTDAGEYNPFRDELKADRVGLAGHSAGGVLASRIGQEDARVSAIVSWDRAQSTPLPDDIPLRTPIMFQFADFNCQQVPVCLPEPYLEAPDPDGPGNKGEDFVRAQAAGVDTMQIAIRAATHLDWTPPVLATSRYGELVSLYYTRAWFDRHLKGADDPGIAESAHARLVAPVFDDSVDRHNISQGFYDPVAALLAADPYAGNVPYRIEGMATADRLSFYFHSKCDIAVPGSTARARSDDMRAQECRAGTAASPGGSGGAIGATMLFGALLAWAVRRRRGVGRRTAMMASP